MPSQINQCLLEASRLVAIKLEPEQLMRDECQELHPDDCCRMEQRHLSDREICRHWARGYCAMGDSCAFPHVGPSPAPVGGSGAVVVRGVSVDDIPSQDELREKDMFIVVKSSVPCKDYQAGKCHRGDKCKFAHVGTARRGSVLCRDWQAGVCTRGDSCKYRHTSRRECDDQEYDFDCYDGPDVGCPTPYRVSYVQHVPQTMHVNSDVGNLVTVRTPVAYTIAQQPTVQRIVRYVTAPPPQPPPQPTVVYNYMSQGPDVFEHSGHVSHGIAGPACDDFYPHGPVHPQALVNGVLHPGFESTLPPSPPAAPMRTGSSGSSDEASSVGVAASHSDAEVEAELLRQRLQEAEARVANLRAAAQQAEHEAALLRDVRCCSPGGLVHHHHAHATQAHVMAAPCADSQMSEDSHPTTVVCEGGSDGSLTPAVPTEQDADMGGRRSRLVVQHDPYAH
eukprot:TRINITY_DN8923_c0_g1_i1.p1 TRINITY_DN8923_c0_g1~~TRINITY_DN8923_c0_g1_i1.p1  ORF type:complete len:470 (+),score=136.08 TRINITY_DN8923_c0_g1_i1:63-1412(+)